MEDAMRRFAWMGIVALVGFGGVSCNDTLEGKEVFIANLTAGEEVPARPTAANGTAQFIVDGNQISYAIEVDDITAITFSHIHALAAPGANAPVRLFLYPPAAGTTPPQVTVTEKHILVQATVDASAVSGITYNELLDAMRSGNAYVNVHTAEFPSGEMRGQIRRANVD